jgi:hypothetical protein
MRHVMVMVMTTTLDPADPFRGVAHPQIARVAATGRGMAR